jgi:carboxyl-terminal processing protease
LDPRLARKIAKVVAIIVALAMIVTSFSFVMLIPGLFGMEGAVVYAGSADGDLDLEMENLKEYIKYIQKNYKDQVTYDQLVEGAFAGVLESLGDPYSVYYGSSTEGDNFIESVTGEFSGVGVSLEDYKGQCRVVAPIPGTPADKSGIKRGDIVRKVNGSILGQDVGRGRFAMRGRGHKGTLEIDRTKILIFTLTRARLKISRKLCSEGNICYIQITSLTTTHMWNPSAGRD